MYSLRNLVTVTGTLLALGVLAPVSQAAAPPSFGALSADKQCGPSTGFTGKIPSYCTITGSNYLPLVGAKVMYTGPELGANGQFVSSNVVILAPAPRAGTAVGYCMVWRTATPLAGMCAFHLGTGSLDGFQAIVKVTFVPGGVGVNLFHWDGVETPH